MGLWSFDHQPKAWTSKDSQPSASPMTPSYTDIPGLEINLGRVNSQARVMSHVQEQQCIKRSNATQRHE